MKQLYFISAILITHLVPCFTQQETPFSLDSYFLQNNLRTQSTKEGLHYVVERQGPGVFPRTGEYAVIRFKAMLLDGTVFDKSEASEPFIFQIGNKEVIKGLDQGVLLMRKEGKFTFYIPASLAYMNTGVGTIVPPNSPVIYEVELSDVLNFEQYDRYMRNLEEREKYEFQQKQKAQHKEDLHMLGLFAIANKLKAKGTASGLSYFIAKQGKGEFAKPGDRMKVSYEGFLMNGNPVELPAGERSYEFILGGGNVLDGWEEGLRFFNQGAEGWLLVPSKLAYGPLAIEEENIDVPANSPIAFKIKVLEILK